MGCVRVLREGQKSPALICLWPFHGGGHLANVERLRTQPASAGRQSRLQGLLAIREGCVLQTVKAQRAAPVHAACVRACVRALARARERATRPGSRLSHERVMAWVGRYSCGKAWHAARKKGERKTVWIKRLQGGGGGGGELT
jgi:hypothetical protein